MFLNIKTIFEKRVTIYKKRPNKYVYKDNLINITFSHSEFNDIFSVVRIVYVVLMMCKLGIIIKQPPISSSNVCH